MEKPKLGGAELTASFQHKIEATAEERFNWFKSKNEQKRNAFVVSLELCPNPQENLFSSIC